MKKPIAILASLAITLTALGQNSIVLRPNAKVDSVRAITLGDVADLTGTEAQRHSAAVVADANRAKSLESGTVAIDIAAIRSALKNSDIKWGLVSLSGGTCSVSMGKVAITPAKEAPVKAAPAVTVKDHVAGRLAQQFGVAIADLKLTYDADRTGILDIATAGRTVTVTPTGLSERMPLTIRVYERNILVTEGSVRVAVQVRRNVMVSRSTIARGERITDADVVEELRWISPVNKAAGVSEVVGAAARTRIDSGAMILAKEVETPAVVRKGDLIAVDSIVGGVVIRMNNARALSDGRDGDEILVEQAVSMAATDKANGRRGKPATIRVRICGPGRAVVSETN